MAFKRILYLLYLNTVLSITLLFYLCSLCMPGLRFAWGCFGLRLCYYFNYSQMHLVYFSCKKCLLKKDQYEIYIFFLIQKAFLAFWSLHTILKHT